MNLIQRAARAVDGAQRRWRIAAFVFAVYKKFGDDRGGSLAALLTFYGFLSLFPLLLVWVTVLSLFPGAGHSLIEHVERSAFAQFPIIGAKLSSNIHQLHRNSALGLAVGIVTVLWGSQGAIQTAQFAQAQVWNVPGTGRPNFWAREARTLAMMGVLVVFLVASTAVAGFATIGHRSAPVVVAGIALSLVLNVSLFAVAFRILTPAQLTSPMLPGAVVGGCAWTAQQYFGGVLVDHTLRNASPDYGFFAIVLGLIAWMYLGAEASLYAAEVNVVWARHLWPRAMVQPPLTTADKQVLSAIVLQDARRPEQRVAVDYDEGAPAGATAEAVESHH